MQTAGVNSGMVQQVLGQGDLFFRFHITVQVMTISDVSTRDQDPVRAVQQGVQDKDRIHPSGAHDPHWS
jgi:hypothetical protein